MMNLFVISELHPGNNHVGWSVNYSLEEVIASTCNATFIYPLPNGQVKLSYSHEILNEKLGIIDRYRHRLFKSWFSIKDLPQLSKGPNVLLVVGLQPLFLLAMHALRGLLNQFDIKIGYILDGFDPHHFDRSLVGQFDQLFVMSAELVDEMNALRAAPTRFLPLATNALKTGSRNLNRWIDVIAYGRGNAELHRCLQRSFNQPDNDRIYSHSTFSQAAVESHSEHMALLTKMLHRSKISLCFEASNIFRFRGYSPILYRWFEAWASGCTVVGKKPFGKGTAALMDWENSAIDIPDSSSDWIPFLEELLDNNEMLALNTQRNYRECLLRHDWRYRIQEMLTSFDLPVPARLTQDIALLQEKASEATTRENLLFC